MADDIAFAPDGTMAWTGFLTGDLYSRKGDGPVKKLASGLPGINSLAFRKDGRLYATQVFLGDALYEIDVEGVKPPRKIMEKMGGLNGFEFGPDDMLYGPLWFKGQVARVDVDKAELSVVADGFKIPAAVNFDSKGNLWVVDTALGQLVQGRSEDRREEDGRAAQALARQSRDRRQGPHLRLQHGRQRHSGGRSGNRRGQAGHLRASWRCPAASASSPTRTDTIYAADAFRLEATIAKARCTSSTTSRRRLLMLRTRTRQRASSLASALSRQKRRMKT